MMTTTDRWGREVLVSPPRRGRCGAVPGRDRAPCIQIAGHDGDHRSIREEWSSAPADDDGPEGAYLSAIDPDLPYEFQVEEEE